MFLKSLQISQKEPLFWSLFLIKLLAFGSANLLKKTPTQVFFCEICEFLRIPILISICERLLPYFHFNSHHCQHHHFHYHCKIHLYHLRILLPILIDCNMIPCLFQLTFVFFFPAYVFFYFYSKLFVF